MRPMVGTRSTAFEGSRRIASGDLIAVVRKVKRVIDREKHAPVLIFDSMTSELIEVDFRGSIDDVVGRLRRQPGREGEVSDDLPSEPARGPGRPRLGVVAREVTLLPRHWEWLNDQPGGASVALRKLVEEARRANEGKDRIRRAKDAAYRFMLAMAGDFAGFEEAMRAFFSGNRRRFTALTKPWAADVRNHARRLAKVAFDESDRS